MILHYKVGEVEIIRTEDYTNVPILPFNMTLEQQKIYYKSQGEDFVAYETEIGSDVYNNTLRFDVNGDFKGLQPK